MTKYYFHVLRNGKILFDPEGVELEGSARAHGEAVQMMAGMASEAIPLRDSLEITIVVADALENVLFRTHLSRRPV
jgi:hypothetical protein